MSDLVHLVPDPPIPSSTLMDQIIDRLCLWFGYSSDPEVREMVLTGLDWAATKLNSAGVALCQVREFTSTGFTVGQTTLDISSATDWLRPYGNVLLYDTDNTLTQQVYWVPWERLRELQEKYSPDDSYYPEACAIQYPDQALIYFNSPLDPAKFGRVLVPYIARVPRPSRTTSLAIPEEVLLALEEGAKFQLMQWRHKGQGLVWQPYERQFANALRGAHQAVMAREADYNYCLFRLEV